MIETALTGSNRCLIRRIGSVREVWVWSIAGVVTIRIATRSSRRNIATVVDSRGKQEITADGADRVPDSSHVIHTPMLGPKNRELSETITTALESGDADTIEGLLGDGKVTARNEEMYTALLNSKDALAGYADTIRTIADSEPSPTPSIPCSTTAPRARTGPV